MKNSRSLKEEFCKYFDLYIATTEELKNDVYRVRYNVYCEEFRFEPKENFPDKMEKDDYDDSSIHCLVVHRSSGRPAGCIRVVPALVGGAGRKMPIERICPEILKHSLFEEQQLDRQLMCEASRLAVDGVFRRRAGEVGSRIGEQHAMDADTVEIEYRSFNIVSESIFLAGLATGEILGTPMAFALMEPFLPRVCRRAGINFEKLGEEVDYHGLRAPYFTDTRNIRDSIKPNLLDLYDYIRDYLMDSYAGLSF